VKHHDGVLERRYSVNAKQPGSKGKPKPKRVYVHELAKKLEFLLKCRNFTKSQVCRQTGIPGTSFDRALQTEDAEAGNEAGDGALGLEHQELLGKCFGFQAVDVFQDNRLILRAWPEWRASSDEPDLGSGEEREDTAKAFRKRYLAHIGKRPSDASSDAPNIAIPSPRTAATPASTEVGRAVVRLGPGVREPVKNLTKSIKLASVSIEGQQWGDGSVVALLTLACNRWRKMTLTRGRVQIFPDPGRMTVRSYEELQKAPITAGFAFGQKVQVAIEIGGTENDPHIDISGIYGPIGKVTLDERAPTLEGLAPGDTVTVRFGTWLQDVATDDQQGGEPQASSDPYDRDVLEYIDRDGKLIEEAFEQLGEYKLKAIALVRQAILLEPGSDGYVELSEHTLRIEKGRGT
jgi:hypothetical protein